MAGTGVWAVVLLARTPEWNPWLAPVIAILTIVAALGVLGWHYVDALAARRRVVYTIAAAGLVGILLGPTAYALTPITNGDADPNPSAGPASLSNGPGAGIAPQGPGPDGTFGPPNGFEDGTGTPPDGSAPSLDGKAAPPDAASTASDAGGGAGPGAGTGGPGRAQVDAELVEYLLANYDDETWVVAAVSAHTTSGIIIEADGAPVMTIGGFNGNDPAPTLDELIDYVDAGEIRYVLLSDSGARVGPGGPGGGNSELASWIAANGAVVDADGYGGSGDGLVLYDLSSDSVVAS